MRSPRQPGSGNLQPQELERGPARLQTESHGGVAVAPAASEPPVSGLKFQLSSPPWIFLAVSLAALVIQLNPAWREVLLYDRTALARGEFWRIWTGHLVHFGWPHYVADAGLFFILGWLLEARHPWFSRMGLVVMPAFIAAAIWWGDPAMILYGGLSAVNLGLLLYLAAQGWQRNWTDWFWPAVLAIYVGEVIFEIIQGGRGGGMIRFDNPGIHVATSAHLASAAYALLAWAAAWSGSRRRQPAAKP